MGKSPEELKGEIARTREHLSGTMDAIEDPVVPSRIVERRKDNSAPGCPSSRTR